ncbi:unnamed protein product, partial [Gadus morhua 'NCC']
MIAIVITGNYSTAGSLEKAWDDGQLRSRTDLKEWRNGNQGPEDRVYPSNLSVMNGSQQEPLTGSCGKAE